VIRRAQSAPLYGSHYRWDGGGFFPDVIGSAAAIRVFKSEHLHGQETESLGNIDCGARKIDVLCIHHKNPNSLQD
jgi:hypothetical protein